MSGDDLSGNPLPNNLGGGLNGGTDNEERERNIKGSQEIKCPAWDLMIELRQEILSLQRLRVQIIGFKIAFMGVAIGYIIQKYGEISFGTLFWLAIISILFDLLINSKEFAINRIAYYTLTYLEDIIRRELHWPDKAPLWEEFMKYGGRKNDNMDNRINKCGKSPNLRENYGRYGNIGFTLVIVVFSFYRYMLETLATPQVGLARSDLINVTMNVLESVSIYPSQYILDNPLYIPKIFNTAAILMLIGFFVYDIVALAKIRKHFNKNFKDKMLESSECSKATGASN